MAKLKFTSEVKNELLRLVPALKNQVRGCIVELIVDEVTKAKPLPDETPCETCDHYRTIPDAETRLDNESCMARPTKDGIPSPIPPHVLKKGCSLWRDEIPF